MSTASEMLAGLISGIAGIKGAKFVSFVYTAKGTGEVARHSLILGASTENLYERDLEALEALRPTLTGIALVACDELIASRRESLEKGVGNNSQYVHGAENADTYAATGIKGLMIHKETGHLHVRALTHGKTVITPGTYKTVKSSEKTIAKNAISKELPSERIRQFDLGLVTRARLNGETLELD